MQNGRFSFFDSLILFIHPGFLFYFSFNLFQFFRSKYWEEERIPCAKWKSVYIVFNF